jgi:outer membrane protein assembly factor BamE
MIRAIMKELQRRGRKMSWRPVLVAATLLALGGCVYRMNIQQGNFLDGTAIAQLQSGMTRAQVRYLLGTPLVPGTFNNERWDYLYYLKEGRLKSAQKRRVTVFFENEKVARIEKEGAPAAGEHPQSAAEAKKASLWRRLIRRADDGPASVSLPSDRR